jgi:hypothetical protein
MTTALAITDRALTTTDVMTAFGALLLIATAQQYGRGLCKAGRDMQGLKTCEAKRTIESGLHRTDVPFHVSWEHPQPRDRGG